MLHKNSQNDSLRVFQEIYQSWNHIFLTSKWSKLVLLLMWSEMYMISYQNSKNTGLWDFQEIYQSWNRNQNFQSLLRIYRWNVSILSQNCNYKPKNVEGVQVTCLTYTSDPFGPLVWTSGPISKFQKLIAHLNAICNHSITKLKTKTQKCRRSSSHMPYIYIWPFWAPCLELWTNFKILKAYCASTCYMQPSYNKIKNQNSKM